MVFKEKSGLNLKELYIKQDDWAVIVSEEKKTN